MRGELSETRRRAAAELVEQKAAMEQTVAQLALEDAEALTERAQVRARARVRARIRAHRARAGLPAAR